ncbi:MAG TPA: hypothetical protein DCG69_11625 [Bacteroidales bacterium]|nr:hypothetical protein [Bacteroidales bacterium]
MGIFSFLALVIDAKKNLMRFFCRSTILLFALTLFGRLPAQNTDMVDSLLLISESATPQAKVLLFIEISEILKSSNAALALKYSNEALALAKNLEKEDLILEALKKTGALYLYSGKMDLAKDYYNLAADLCKKQKNYAGLAENIRSVGLVYSRKGDLTKAKEYFIQSYEFAKTSQDTFQIILSSVSLGNTCLKQGNYEQALAFFNSALFFVERNHSFMEERARIYNNLGVLFSEKGKYAKSLQYYERAAWLYDSLNNQADLGKTYNNIGTIYWYSDKADTARLYYEKSLRIRKALNDTVGEAYVLNNLGMLAGEKGDLILAKSNFEKALLLFEQQQYRNGCLLVTYNLGEAYFALNQFAKAEKHYHQSLTIAKNDGVLDYVLANLYGLTELYKQNKDYEKAAKTFESYSELKDSISTSSNTQQLIEMEARFDSEKNKTRFDLLEQGAAFEKKKVKRNNWLLAGILFTTLLSLFIFYLLTRKGKIKRRQQLQQLETKLLKHQMIPGFLFCSFNAIRDFLYKNKNKDTSLYLSNFARTIRAVIDKVVIEQIALDQEIETLENYFKLRQMGYEKLFHYTIDISETTETEFIQVPPFLFFPFFELFLDRFGSSDFLSISITINENEERLDYTTDISFSGSHFIDLKDLRLKLNTTLKETNRRIDLIKSCNQKNISLVADIQKGMIENNLHIQLLVHF